MVQPLDRRLMTEATFQDKAAEQDGKIGDYISRVEAVEVLGGLAPGDVSDATVKSLLANPATETATALSAAIVESIPKATAYPALTVPTYDSNPSTGHPDVLYIPGGWNGYKYWMGHTPFPLETRENPSVVASHDGVTWVVPSGLTNPVATLADAVAMGYQYWADTDLVLSHDGVTMMLYFKGSKPGGLNHYVRMTSTNGVTWTTPQVVVDGTGSPGGSPAIVREPNGTYTMFEVASGLAKRTSTNGTDWSARIMASSTPGFNDGFGLWHVDVCKVGNTYHALVNASKGGTPKPIFRLFYWTSEDGINWVGSKDPAVPLTGGRLDSNGHYRSTIQPAASGIAGRFDLWTTQIDDSKQGYDTSVWRIGHIRNYDFSSGAAWSFPSMTATPEEIVVYPPQILQGGFGEAVRARVPAVEGGTQAVGLKGTGQDSVSVAFPPMPDTWSFFTLEALIVNDDEGVGDVVFAGRMGHHAPGTPLTSGLFIQTPSIGAGTRLVPRWVRVDGSMTKEPVRALSGGLTTVELRRPSDVAGDTFTGTIWILAIRLRRSSNR